MTAQSLTQSPRDDLYHAWQILRRERPLLRTRDAAQQLAVSEAELVASRLGLDALRLRPEWAQLLPALETLGEVMALTRNEHCVHERWGQYCEVTVAGNGRMGLVVTPDIDLRLFLQGWASVFAIEEEGAQGVQRSIQVFDHQGTAVHKVFLGERSRLEAWRPLLDRFCADDQSPALALSPLPAKPPQQPDAQVDVESLRQHWAALKDVHHFLALLNKHSVCRDQALRLAGREWAEPLASDALPGLLERAATHEVPLMLFVGNAHCIQIHSGTVNNLRWAGDWFNVLDPQFNLHLKTSAVAELWRVRRPSSDGLITSWEAYNADGELILQVFGARKPGVAERRDWRQLADSVPAEAL